jgi:dCMP deaminase
MTERIDLDEAYMQMAEVWSLRSYATRSKVGALIVNPFTRQIISDGWNGMPSGFPNDEVEFKNPDGSLTTNPLVLHAESNAILKCAAEHGGAKDCTLYCTMSPCPDCAKLIIQAKIKRVVYRNDYRISEGIPILQRAGIEVVKLLRPAEITEFARVEAEKQAAVEAERLAAVEAENNKPKYEIVTCPNCYGHGRQMLFPAIEYSPTCTLCSGSGKIKRSLEDGRIVA